MNKPKIQVERFDETDFVVTIDGHVVGNCCSLKDAKRVINWLNGSWKYLKDYILDRYWLEKNKHEIID